MGLHGTFMNISYDFDYILIGTVLFFAIIGAATISNENRKAITIKSMLFFFLSGLLLIVIAVFSNSFVEHSWGKNYIFSFMLLKRVSKGWFFRHICSIGYLSLIISITLLISIVKNKRAK
jgi:hypothetical protein